MNRVNTITRLLLSGVAAAGAGLIALFATGPVLGGSEPSWMAESVAGFLVAAVWMTVGILVAKPHDRLFAPVGLCLGAAAAWFLARGIVHSTSPYYGLVPYIAACVGGAASWLFHRRRTAGDRFIMVPVGLPLALIGLGVMAASLRAPLSTTRWVMNPDSVRWQLPVLAAGDDGHPREWYIWSQHDTLITSRDGSTIYIELDPGSGSGQFYVAQVHDPTQIQRACTAFRAEARRVIQSEISAGTIPRFIAAFPVRRPACERGRVWTAREDVA